MVIVKNITQQPLLLIRIWLRKGNVVDEGFNINEFEIPKQQIPDISFSVLKKSAEIFPPLFIPIIW